MDKKKEEGVMDLTPLMDVVRTLQQPWRLSLGSGPGS